MKGDSLPYVAKAAWFIKLIALPSIVLPLIFIWSPSVLFELWEESGWIFRVCMLFSMVMIPVGLMQLFVRKSVFDESGIHHRSWRGARSFRAYSEVEALKYEIESLKIIFSDGRSIKVRSGEANLLKVTKIIRDHTSGPLTAIRPGRVSTTVR